MRHFLILSLLFLAACTSTPPGPAAQAIPREWLSTPETPRIVSVELRNDGSVRYLRQTAGGCEIVEPDGTTAVATCGTPLKATDPSGVEIVAEGASQRIARNGKPLTPSFHRVEAFDYSRERDEVVFSARRENNFDIALVAGDGSGISWVPEDPSDEMMPLWAPRGHKVSYVVRARSGDIVRTVHVPTAFQLSVEFPYARVRALAWDPPAEKYAVAYEAIDTSPRIDVLRYSGEGRQTAVPSASRLQIAVEPVGDVLVLRPMHLKYGERLPLVVWMESDPYAWNDARAELMKKARVAVAVARETPGAAFWDSAGAASWIDLSQTYVVGADKAPPIARSTRIVGDRALAPGTFRRTDGVVSVSDGVIQSFAAGFIADALSRPSPHASH